MTPDALRIIDANLNRAREALRVLEDYARFALDDAPLAGALKQLRHALADATRGIADDAILHRDTPGDVGTATKAAGELMRQDLAHVVTAAAKRLGEALRTIEEYSKIDAPAQAGQIEALRYQFYAIEQQIALTLRPAVCGFASVKLCVLVTHSLCKRPWLETCEEAIAGGADCIQLREKAMEGGELLIRARQLADLCRRRSVKSIINDRPDIAMMAGADGVHVGQQDLPARQVRKLVGRHKIVGVSTHCLDQARQALLDGADYIGVGPVFRSKTKPRDFLPGLDYARQVAAEIQDKIPAVAIAGIAIENVDEVLASGLRAIAVSSAVIGAQDVRAATRQLKDQLDRARVTRP